MREAEKCYYPVFQHIANSLPDVSQWKEQYMLQRMIVRLMILYHELGHYLFYSNENEKTRWYELVINNVKNIDEHLGDYVRKGKKISKREYRYLINSVLEEENRDYALVEEMAADAFALSKAYATMHLNIHVLPKEFVSDNVSIGAMRYLHLATSYVYIIKFWNQLFTMSLSSGKCYVSKKEAEKLIERLNKIEFARYEIGTLPVVVSVLNLDIDTWGYVPPEGMLTVTNPRLKRTLHIFSNNMQYCGEAIGSALNYELINHILDEIKSSDTNPKRYVYDGIDENAFIVTWLAIQYDNFSGLSELEEDNYEKAIEFFCKALQKSIMYLGEKHRLTARVFNNLCQCYLVMYLKTVSGEIETDYTLEELKYYATMYSNKAVECIGNEKYDIQAASIYQNAGEVSCLNRSFDEALSFYLLAKEIKEQIDEEYSISKVKTDLSLAEIYFMKNRFLDAKYCCKRIIEYFNEQNAIEENSILDRSKQLYEMINDAMNPANSMNIIIESLLKGETVDLDQYNDWEEIRKKCKE